MRLNVQACVSSSNSINSEKKIVKIFYKRRKSKENKPNEACVTFRQV